MSATRLAMVHTKAESIALELIRSNLASDNPAYAELCRELAPYKPMLAGKDEDDAKVKAILRTGFKSLKFFKLTPCASLEADAVSLLLALTKKLSGMKSMLL